MTSQKIVPRSLILWVVILGAWHCTGEKLSPNQKAPLFARGAGGLILNTPFEDNKARRGPASTSIATANVPVNDEVQREETEELKLVDGQLVRTVKGSFAYKSPEGLPISVKYEADENGNRASFKFGTGEVKVGGSSAGPPRGGGPSGGRNGGPTRGPAGPGSKGKDYLPPKDVDRSYLPPK
ncbi:uncharacterized protein LOC108629654 [Ceratina calcarata]|uniref:Uncharacterized protein LOC108629654 n=1 Tax=Ceratina calcarata TaxID=156304 RepID=A0AAJ7NCP7_9HYME|nr:uncharacterized protein LOC108629654 [Ceratina calcarata]